jgi:hypothetical protein
MRSAAIIFILGLFIFSCRPTRNIQTAIAKKDTVEVITPPVKTGEDSAAIIRENFAKLMKQKITYSTFSAKIDVDYEGGDGNKEKANANLRMYRDSLIWISITGPLGIEGMRAYITKDSVKMINKLDKIYIARSVAYVQEITGLPLDLASMQDLIIGNPVLLDSNIVSYTRAANTISLLNIGVWFKNFITLNDGIMNHSKLDDVDISRSRTCDLSYDDYENKRGVNFSAKRRITISEKSKLDIKLDFKNYIFNETLNVPFSVPKNYRRN